MAEESKSFHGRDLQAMTLNMKEQRVLKKKLQTLALEESFSMKSLNLDKMQIKLFQKRLCTTVGRIKSHLTVEDIAFMKQLEREGRFVPEVNPVNISNAGTIASAAKRLKLLTNAEILQITESDLYKHDKDDDDILLATPRESGSREAAQKEGALLSAREKQSNAILKPELPEATTITDLPPSANQNRSAKNAREIPEATTFTQLPHEISSRNKSARNMRDNRSRSLPPPSETVSINSKPGTGAIKGYKPSKLTDENKLPSLDTDKAEDTSSGSDVVDGMTSRQRSRSTSRASDLDEASSFSRPNSSINRPQTSSRSRINSRGPNRVQTARDTRSTRIRPMTTSGFPTSRRQKAVSPSRPKTSTGVESSDTLNYSSHKTVILQPNPISNASGRRMSVLSSSSLGGEIAKERAAEQRKLLLSAEESLGNNIEDRRQTFLSRMGKWVEDNPSIIDNTASKFSLIEATDLHMLKPDPSNQIALNEGLFTNDIDAWKDLKKCRYLRMADDEIDLSGINTLARDNLQFFGGFRIKYDKPTPKKVIPKKVLV